MALSTAAKRGPPPIINGGQTWPAANASRARCTPACRPGLARPSAHPARVLFDGDELLDGGREKPSAKTMSIQSAPPEPERAGKGTRRMLRSLSASANRHGRAMASCPHGNLEVWPVTGSAVTSGTNGHSEEALGIGKGASSAAWQRHLKAKRARLGVGALRSRSGT